MPQRNHHLDDCASKRSYVCKARRAEGLPATPADLLSLRNELKAVQAASERLQYDRSSLRSNNALSKAEEYSFQRTFDKLSDMTVELAETAAQLRANTLEQLCAKAHFVIELACNSEDELIDQLIFGLADDLIKFGAAHEAEFTE